MINDVDVGEGLGHDEFPDRGRFAAYVNTELLINEIV